MICAQRLLVSSVTILCVYLGGCAASGPSTANFSVRHLPDADVSQAFGDAEAVLLGQGYALERRDPASGMLVTHPIETAYRERYGNQARRLGTEGRLRRFAAMHTSEAPGGVNVFCRVTIQEQSTQVYRFLAESNRAGSSEESTAIDRDAGTTARQNSVWRNVDRDRTAERALLEAVGTLASAKASPRDEESSPAASPSP